MNDKMLERASKVLPYGASTYSRSHVAFGRDYPSLYATHADGWRIFVDGRDLCDCVMGLGSVIAGHRHPYIDDAIKRQLCQGTAMSLASPIEIEAAERLLAHFPDDCMVQWGTNGTDATTGAIRLARAVTGRELVLMAKDGYHGFADWSLAGTLRGFGIIGNGQTSHVATFEGMLFAIETDQCAAVIIEPDLHPDWLKPLRDATTAHGTLLIADEVMTWQRYPEWTGCAHYGITPDLWCLGKSLGNGMPASAVIGPRDIMRRFAPPGPNAFFSSTWAGHPLSMAAVVATLDVMEREKGPQKIWDMAVALPSVPPFNRMRFPNDREATRFRRHMNKHGVLIYGSFNLSLAHDGAAMHRIKAALAAKIDDDDDDLKTDEPNGIMRR